MLTLYGFKGSFSRNFRCQWALEEAGLPYKLVELDFLKNEHKSPDIVKLNPLGRLPVLVEDGKTLVESAAICNYIGEKVPEKGLTPRPGTWERAQYDSWMFYVAGDLEAQQVIMGKHRAPHYYPPEKRSQNAMALAQTEFLRHAKRIHSHLNQSAYLVGDNFTMADIFLCWVLRNSAGLLGDLPGLINYTEKCESRPGYPKPTGEPTGIPTEFPKYETFEYDGSRTPTV